MSTAVLTPTAVTTPGRHTVGRWVIAPEGTSVEIRLRAFGVRVRGAFGEATGLIDVPDDITRSQVSVTIPAESFTTGGPLRDRRVAGARMLDAAAHPHLTFSATGLLPITEALVTAGGDRPLWWLQGELTARGHTRPLRLALGSVSHGCDGGTLEFRATATLRRSDFGVNRFRGAFGDVVDVDIRGLAHRYVADG